MTKVKLFRDFVAVISRLAGGHPPSTCEMKDSSSYLVSAESADVLSGCPST